MKVMLHLTEQQNKFLQRKAEELRFRAPALTIEGIISALIDHMRLLQHDMVLAGDDTLHSAEAFEAAEEGLELVEPLDDVEIPMFADDTGQSGIIGTESLDLYLRHPKPASDPREKRAKNV